MIKSSDYNHKLYRIAKEGELNGWFLRKEIEPKLKILQRYNAKEGYYYRDVAIEAFPTVVLYHDYTDKLRMMATNPVDHEDCSVEVERARGKVLTGGLGVGLFPVLIEDKLRDGRVTSLDIIELSTDVIELSSPVVSYLPNTRVNPGDIAKYLEITEKKYDFIFIDIWAPRAQAIAEGPGLVEIAQRCLNPGGEARFWVQGVWERIKNSRRGLPYSIFTSVDNPCWLCGDALNHSHLYGGLCRECADDYETFLGKGVEDRGTVNIKEALKSLGFRSLETQVKLPEGRRADMVDWDSNILFEMKRELLTTAQLDECMKDLIKRRNLRSRFNKFIVIIQNDVTPELYIQLKDYAREQFGDWVDIHYGGKLVEGKIEL